MDLLPSVVTFITTHDREADNKQILSNHFTASSTTMRKNVTQNQKSHIDF